MRRRCLTSTGRIDVLAATIAAQCTCSHSGFEAAASNNRCRSSAVNARPTGRWRSGRLCTWSASARQRPQDLSTRDRK